MYTIYFIFEWKYAFSIAFNYCMLTWLSNQERRKKEKRKSLRKKLKSNPLIPSRTSFVRFTSNDLGHRFLFQFHRVNCTLKSNKKEMRCMSIILERTKGVVCFAALQSSCFFLQRLMLWTLIIQPFS